MAYFKYMFKKQRVSNCVHCNVNIYLKTKYLCKMSLKDIFTANEQNTNPGIAHKMQNASALHSKYHKHIFVLCCKHLWHNIIFLDISYTVIQNLKLFFHELNRTEALWSDPGLHLTNKHHILIFITGLQFNSIHVLIV